MDKKISTLEHNNRTVYECFNNTFTDNCGSPAMHLPPITIDDRSPPHKIARYAPDLLPAAISVASENSVSNLTIPSDYPQLLPSSDTNPLHFMNKDDPYLGRVRIGYCCMKHDKNMLQKVNNYIAPHPLIRTRHFSIVMGCPGLASCNINILCNNFSVDRCVCIPSIIYFTC